MTYDIQTRGHVFGAQLPPEYQTLLRDYPRDAWPDHPHFARSIQNWLGAHRMFEQLSALIEGKTELYLTRQIDPQAYARDLAYYGDLLLRNLHGHHTWEDRSYFPELKSALKDGQHRLESGLDMLERDHDALDETLHQFQRAANRTVQLAQLDAAQMPTEAAAVDENAKALSALLERHLSDEEEIVVPILLHHKMRG